AIGLSIEELIAVDVWMFHREGEEPPSVEDIRNAYEKFIPEEERISLAPGGDAPVGGLDPSKIALPDDDPQAIIKKMGCAACHQIPGIEIAKTGMIGPILVEKFNSPRRLASPEYKAAVKAGKAHATNAKDYIIESIMDPSAYVVKEFEMGNPTKSMMPADFNKKFTYSALSNLADYLLEQDCEAAKKDGLTGPPLESVAKICG
ncbi:MAG TPA: c-type cytochrome, partial [Nitrospiria bacterium]|nr:c-type cytochrome [Nitrospiria bacterium]